MPFSRPGKLIDLRKNGQGQGKVKEVHFSVQIFHAVKKDLYLYPVQVT